MRIRSLVNSGVCSCPVTQVWLGGGRAGSSSGRLPPPAPVEVRPRGKQAQRVGRRGGKRLTALALEAATAMTQPHRMDSKQLTVVQLDPGQIPPLTPPHPPLRFLPFTDVCALRKKIPPTQEIGARCSLNVIFLLVR